MGDNGDPDSFLYVFLDKSQAIPNGGNYAVYKSDELHDILIEAQRISDQMKRTGLYERAQEIIHEDTPWVPLAYINEVIAMNKKVQNLNLQPAPPSVRLREVWIEE